MVKIDTVIFRKEKSKKKNLDEVARVQGKKDTQEAVRKKATKDLDNLARGSARVILDIKAVFPFNFFPDEIIVDETKVSIHTNYFFYTSQVRSIEYKDIFNVIVQQGAIFAKLEIVDRFFAQNPITVEYLKKKDAQKARRIIQGMIIARKENINIQSLPLDQLLASLERIGQSR